MLTGSFQCYSETIKTCSEERVKYEYLHTGTAGNRRLFKDDVSTLKFMHVSALRVNHGRE